MGNALLAAALRAVMNTIMLSGGRIDKIIKGEIREETIAPHAVIAIQALRQNPAAFALALHTAITNLGATLTAAGTYDIANMNISDDLAASVGEELNAIRTHAPTPGFNASKAITNMLRLIKALER